MMRGLCVCMRGLCVCMRGLCVCMRGLGVHRIRERGNLWVRKGVALVNMIAVT